MLGDITMAEKLQFVMDEETRGIINKLKPRAVKLFVSIAIEQFSKKDEAKLFFKNNKVNEEKNNITSKKIVEVRETSTIEEWD